MKNCHVCGVACENDADICSVCGAELKTFELYEKELLEEKERQEEIEREEALIVKNPVLAANVDNVVTAEIFKDVLRDNGIRFTVDESDEAIRVVFGGGFDAVKIFVDEENLERVQELYKEIEESETEFDDDFFEDLEEEQ